METSRIGQLTQEFYKKLKPGFFILELNQKNEHRLFLDDHSMFILNVDKSLSPEECFKFITSNIDKEDKKLVANSIETILVQENAEFCFSYKKKNGSKILVRCSGIKDNDCKSCVRIEGYVLDISHTIIIQRMNQKYQDELYDKLYLMPFICYLKLATTGQYVAVSKQYMDFIGIQNRDDIVGKTDFDLFEEEFAKKAVQEDKYALCLDRPLGLNESFVDQKGNRRYFQTYRTKYIDSLGRDVVFGISMDVTETHVLTEEKQKLLVKARSKAEESNTAKTRFLYNISQDIRNPVNSIITSTDRAFRHRNDEGIVLDSLEKIKDSSDGLLNLVNGIAEILQFQYGQISLNETPNSLSDFIKDIASEFVSLADKREIAIRFDFNGFRNKYAYFDTEKMGKIFRNLVSNAIKFSNFGGKVNIRGKQFVSETPGYSKFVIDIEDNGIGMSEAFLSNIFGLFEKERSAKENGFDGSGLGMAIVKALVSSMKGDIKITSAVNKGTTVELIFNLKNSSKEDVSESNNRVEDLDFAISLSKGKTILLVDDDEVSMEMTEDLLKEFGFEVETASNGAVAANIVSRKGLDKYSLILMNAQMPVMSGFEASRELKSLFPESKTPIVLLTSNDLFGFTNEDQTVDGFIAKPINIDKLKEIVLKFLK